MVRFGVGHREPLPIMGRNAEKITQDGQKLFDIVSARGREGEGCLGTFPALPYRHPRLPHAPTPLVKFVPVARATGYRWIDELFAVSGHCFGILFPGLGCSKSD